MGSKVYTKVHEKEIVRGKTYHNLRDRVRTSDFQIEIVRITQTDQLQSDTLPAELPRDLMNFKPRMWYLYALCSTTSVDCYSLESLDGNGLPSVQSVNCTSQIRILVMSLLWPGCGVTPRFRNDFLVEYWFNISRDEPTPDRLRSIYH